MYLILMASAIGATCTGTVVDEFDEPLIGASVMIKGTSTAVSTDIDGNFRIACQSGQTLQFSYVGYVTYQHCVSSQQPLQIQMCEDSNATASCAGTPCSGGGTGGGQGCTTLPCTACATTAWQTIYNGYESRKTGGTCSGNSCTSNGTCSGQITEYRCADGYAGAPYIKAGTLYLDKSGNPTGCYPIPSCSGSTCCGLVLDNADKSTSVVGATVMIKNVAADTNATPNAVATNVDGAFSISNCMTGMTMYVYSLGYVRQKITLSSSNMHGNIIYMDEDDGDGVCDDGYYTDWSTGRSKCMQCPTHGNVNAVLPSNIAISGEITDCRVPKNTPYSDTAGIYEYTYDCYYKE